MLGTTAQQRNELLDETGSDFRPLVDLLLDLGHAVRPALQSGAIYGFAGQVDGIWTCARCVCAATRVGVDRVARRAQ